MQTRLMDRVVSRLSPFINITRRSAWLLLSLSVSSIASADTLSSLAVLAFDEPSIQSAIADQQAARARQQQALGALLPQINATANTQANQRTYETRNSPFLSEEKDRYNSHSWQVNLTQPLWRYNLWADKAQAKAQFNQAQFQLTAIEQNTLAKLSEAWFELLMARDQVLFSQAQERTATEQQRMVERGLSVGLYGLPDQQEALSKLYQAQSDTFAAQQEVSIKQAALSTLIGSHSVALPHLDLAAGNGHLSSVFDQYPLAKWLTMVEATNADIQGAYYAQEAAREEVGKQVAGYLPSVDIVASYGSNSQAIGGFPGQNGYDIGQHYVGLQANWGLWSSGVQTAKVKEMHARLYKAEQVLETAKRSARFNTQQAWYNAQIGLAKQHSAEQDIQAAHSRLQASQQGQHLGLKFSLDSLQAQQQLATAQRDYKKAVYQQLLAFIKLQVQASLLTPKDILRVDALFNDAIKAETP